MNQKKSGSLLSVLLFPGILLYYETVFRLSTSRDYFHWGTLFLYLLCIGMGCAGYLLTTLVKNRKANYGISLVLTALLSLPYLIEYFIFKQFGIFYDLSTIFNAAADALGGFHQDILAMIFSWDGALKILLLLLPTVLLAVFGRKLCFAPSNWKKRLIALAAMAVLLLGTRLGISWVKPLELLVTSQYNFQSAVGRLGLLPGVALDIRSHFSSPDSGFEDIGIPTMPDMPTLPPETTEATEATEALKSTEDTTPETTEATEPPVVREPQVMDIDFATLEASGIYAELNAYVAAQEPSMTNEYTGLFAGKNLIFLTAEAFSAEAIDPELTPTLYRMATKGIRFTDYYQPTGAGTTGGEYQNIFGMICTNGGLSFQRAAYNNNYFTMGSQLNRLGYWGRAHHNNDHTYYNRHITHITLGYSEGFLAYGNGLEKHLTNQWPQSDLEMIQGTLPDLLANQPFNTYYMTVSGHSTYYPAGNACTKKNWDRVQHLECSDFLKGYYAAQLELEDAMAYLLEQLELNGILDDTVIVITPDHFPYGLDDGGTLGNMPYLEELYGARVLTELYRDHSTLLIWSGCLEDMETITVDSPTFAPDILPTLSNLFGTEYDSRLLPGRDALSDTPALVYNLSYDWKTEYGTYYAHSYKFVPASEDITVPEGYVEAVSAVVRNKVRYCKNVLEYDYFGYLFNETE